MGAIAIDLVNVKVHYLFERNQSTSLKEFVLRYLKRQVQMEKVHALDDVSLQINRGETVGIIGHNGAGKSTLLKLISGIIRPTAGRVRIWGKVTSLLSVGAGFNREMTGRENIFLYSAMLGRTDRETTYLFDSIVDFSGLEKFIDSPLRIYSTGMVARLGFAVALARQPEIILVDEILAVGDTEFQEKCKQKFLEFQMQGATIVFVSHNMPELRRLCRTTAWFQFGKLISYGPSHQVIDAYASASQQIAREKSGRHRVVS